MGKKAGFVAILLILTVADVASATFLGNFRRSMSSAAKESSNEAISANPSPAPVSAEERSKDKPVAKAPPPETSRSGEKGGEKKDEGKGNEPPRSSEMCDLNKQYCKDASSMVACVHSVDKVNDVLVVLIQNEGDKKLEVHIKSLSQEKLQDKEVPGHKVEKIKIPLGVAGAQISLNAGSGECALQTGIPAPKLNIADWIPPYGELMTPIYGAYFLLAATLLALSVFICCKLRKRGQDEVPYHELEMGEMPESTNLDIDIDTAEGWDEGWDDDWDDDKAIKSPVARHAGSVSANGLTARSGSREAGDDWDD